MNNIETTNKYAVINNISNIITTHLIIYTDYLINPITKFPYITYPLLVADLRVVFPATGFSVVEGLSSTTSLVSKGCVVPVDGFTCSSEAVASASTTFSLVGVKTVLELILS